ncbi:AAA family ATPase [Thiocapsa imhoffii]|uniref:AAA family ATPase n=1 Tax=Thiocapsa imhoffii TaxID=382777 RepID=A0A9X1BBF0_9GAMM|nr:MoxR family ATPase [Thiocapsa imhoffii]MBK1646625.1 AAA family ATPase [Thiocapsa imhoffii]
MHDTHDHPPRTAPSPPPTAAQVTHCAETLAALEQGIGGVLIGQQRVIRESVVALAAAGHVLLEGVPGVGKTLLVRALAVALGGRFSRIQFTPDLMPSDVTGHAVFDSKSETFRIRRGPIFCNLLLGDEINRAPPKTQAALLEAMQEQQVTIEGASLALTPPFSVFATQNPIEHEGTYPLPRAQLDRFLLKIIVDHPNADDELAMVRQVTHERVGDLLDVSAVVQILNTTDLIALQQVCARLQVADSVLAYAVRLVRAAREWPGIETGPGPRTGIALIRAARAHALVGGRDFVTPDDIKAMAAAVLRHRLTLSADLEMEGLEPDDLMDELLRTVPAPRP